MHVKPNSGQQVADPEKGGYLPPEGRQVQPTIYWLRRITEKDVVEVKPTKAKSKESRAS